MIRWCGAVEEVVGGKLRNLSRWDLGWFWRFLVEVYCGSFVDVTRVNVRTKDIQMTGISVVSNFRSLNYSYNKFYV